MGDGPDLNSDYALLSRGKRHDYFTSCLPWPQKGPSVNLPLGSSAPVRSGGNSVETITLQGFETINISNCPKLRTVTITEYDNHSNV